MSASVPPAVLPAASLGVGFGGPALVAGLTASRTQLKIITVWWTLLFIETSLKKLVGKGRESFPGGNTMLTRRFASQRTDRLALIRWARRTGTGQWPPPGWRVA